MANRFTDTEIWDEDWFLELPLKYMVAWFFIKDRCDMAGFWRPNLVRIRQILNQGINPQEFADCVNGDGKIRILILPNGRWFLTGFFKIQYGEKFSTDSNLHKSVQKAWEKNGLDPSKILSHITKNHYRVDFQYYYTTSLAIAPYGSLKDILIDTSIPDYTGKGTVVRGSISVVENNNISTREKKTVDEKVSTVDEHDLSVGNMDEITEEDESLRSPPPPKAEPPDDPAPPKRVHNSGRGPRKPTTWLLRHFWPSDQFLAAWEQWKDYKWDVFGFNYAKSYTEENALKGLHEMVTKVGGGEELAIKVIEHAISRQWEGLYETPQIKDLRKQIENPKPTNTNGQQHSTFNNGHSIRKRPDDISNIQASFSGVNEAFGNRGKPQTRPGNT